MNIINQYKVTTGRIVDAMISGNQSPYITAELSILKGRKTKGHKAALLTGLIVGALCERSRPDLAEQLLHYIAKIADDHRIT
jgi:hypothetical protein